ncbi:MAG TPA: capsule assembly Wzi family protein [Bacillota bacterium]|nr:capsule assembly Wzi family protein [Bacillota bacterium]HQD80843.1 capsule assembly Wzi family protein [Bacillota bacterium]
MGRTVCPPDVKQRASGAKAVLVWAGLLALIFAVLAWPAGGLAASLDASGDIRIYLVDPSDAEPAFAIEHDGLELIAEFGSDENSLFVGAGSLRWGPGRSGSLMMSGRAEPMPLVGYHLSRGNSDYVRFIGLMESDEARRLIGHRLEYTPTPDVVLGVSETAVVSQNASRALYLPFPGFPLYALQRVVSQQDRAQDSLININLGADFSLSWDLMSSDFAKWGGFAPRMELYGEIFIDDAQGHIPNRAYVPDMVGGLVGIDLPKLPWNLRFGANIEYVAIANFVYSHRNPNNDYVYRGVMLGHPLGPDSDMLVLTLSYCPDKCAKLTLSGAVERHGEGRAGQSWSHQHEPEEWFLSGVVETCARAVFGIERELAPMARLMGSLEYATKSNSGNVLGQASDEWNMRIGVGVKL